MWVHRTPSGVCPQSCWWVCLEREHIFPERWQRLLRRDKSMKQAANFVAFIQLAPHWQKSVTCTNTLEAARKRRKRKLEVKRAVTFPMWMEAWSPGRLSGSPHISAFDRSGGGPPGRSRARDQDLQGEPKWAARIAQDRTQPRRRERLFGFKKS